jgi:small subunit ribosomal protein S16
MLAIRLQRVGRKGHAMYRIVVQESQRHPLGGRVVAYVGTYDPHTKDAKVQVETAQKYLDNGAQPSPRVVKLLKDADVKLPKWVVEVGDKKTKSIRHIDKLRKNQPKGKVVKPVEVKAPTEAVEPTEEAVESTEVNKPVEVVEPSAPAEVAETIEVKEPVETVETVPKE